MDKIFDKAKAEGRGLVGNSHTDGHGVNSPAMKKEMAKKMSSFERINKERKSQGYKPNTDRATKGLYDFLDKFDK